MFKLKLTELCSVYFTFSVDFCIFKFPQKYINIRGFIIVVHCFILFNFGSTSVVSEWLKLWLKNPRLLTRGLPRLLAGGIKMFRRAICFYISHILMTIQYELRNIRHISIYHVGSQFMENIVQRGGEIFFTFYLKISRSYSFQYCFAILLTDE